MTIDCKEPAAIVRHGQRRFVAIPLNVKGRLHELQDVLYEAALQLHGEGLLLQETDGVQKWQVFVLDGFQGLVGDWIVRYEYTDNDGIGSVNFWVAAEII